MIFGAPNDKVTAAAPLASAFFSPSHIDSRGLAGLGCVLQKLILMSLIGLRSVLGL